MTTFKLIALILGATTFCAACSSNETADGSPDGDGGAGSSNSDSDGSGGSTNGTSCANLPPSECSRLEGCMSLTAIRLDEDDLCSESLVGCAEPGCAADYVFATDPENDVEWIFANSCIPEGWQELRMPARSMELIACMEGN